MSFSGAQEIGPISRNLPDDPAGITCMCERIAVIPHEKIVYPDRAMGPLNSECNLKRDPSYLNDLSVILEKNPLISILLPVS